MCKKENPERLVNVKQGGLNWRVFVQGLSFPRAEILLANEKQRQGARSFTQKRADAMNVRAD
jgi:hypothetical protein